MNKEKQPDLFPRAENPEEEITEEPNYPKEVSDEIQTARKKRLAEKKTAEDALAAGRRKFVGETKEGQKESFRE